MFFVDWAELMIGIIRQRAKKKKRVRCAIGFLAWMRLELPTKRESILEGKKRTKKDETRKTSAN